MLVFVGVEFGSRIMIVSHHLASVAAVEKVTAENTNTNGRDIVNDILSHKI